MKQQNKLDAVLARVKGNKRAQRIAAALACLVVFVTLWQLTLPAITLEWGKPQAEGITEPEVQEEELLTEETLAEDTEEEEPVLRWATLKEAEEAGYPDAVRVDRLICGQTESEGHRHSADCIESYYTAQAASFAEEAFLTMPAQRFEGEAGSLSVRVDAEEGTFPEATEMALTEADAEKVRRAAAGLVNGRISQVLAVDIGFLYEGEKIEPEQPVQVVLSGSALEGLQNPVVLHIDGEGNAEIVSHRTAEEAAPAPRLRMAARSVQPEETLTETTDETAENTEGLTEETLSEEAPEETIAEDSLPGEEELPKGALVFEAKDFSVYAVVTTIETTYITADGETYGIKVTYGEDAGIPEGAALEVRELSEEEYTDYRVRTAEALGCQENAIGYLKLLDISIVKDGEPIQPQAKVDVEIRLLDKVQSEGKEETGRVVHFGEEAEELACTAETVKETPAVTFQTDAFSVYAVTYTVDFEYSVNGKMYQFSLPGGGFVSFTKLIEALGIIGDTNSEENRDENESGIAENAEENAANEGVLENGVNSDTNTALTLGDVEVSEATREFVADVASVEFSSPELVDVSKVEADTTVGQIKENRGLECVYSAELMEEQITEINAQTIEAGDWALISVQPFASEESLTITMKNGDQFVVKVTDAQRPYTNVNDLENGTYIIYKSDNSSQIQHFLKNDGTTEVIRPATNPINAEYLSPYTWTVNKNNNGTFTIKSTQGNRYIDLNGGNQSTTWSSSYNRSVSLSNNKDGIVVTRDGKSFNRSIGGNFYVTTGSGVGLTFFKIEDTQSSGTTGVDGIVLTDAEREELEKWKNTLDTFNTLTNYGKTAEVVDQDNRIYKIDITADSGITDFFQDIDLGFVLDVSMSMKFPSSLKALEDAQGNEQKVWLSQDWLTWARDAYPDYYNRNGCFYVISDPAVTSTIYKVYWDTSRNAWRYHDASEEYPMGSNNSRVYEINNNTVLPKDVIRQPYTLYYADDKDNKTRFDYLRESVSYSIAALKKIVTPTASIDDGTASVRVAYNLFCKEITASDTFKDLRNQTVHDTWTIPLVVGNMGSGTQQNRALYDPNGRTYERQSANEFGWDNTHDQYVILVTDGAPNGPTMDDVRTAAANLKRDYPNIKIFTIGLSTKDVDGGSRMLYDIASDVDGKRQFYEAEKAQDLEYILLQILRTIITEGLVRATITDTIDNAFYPVDAQGNPLTAGVYSASDTLIQNARISDYVSNGKPLPAHQNDAFYTLEQVGDEWKITWYNQEIGWDDNDSTTGNPWKGTVYVKSKEDYLGGNLIETNDGNAQIEPTGIKLVINGTPETNWRPLEDMPKIDLPVPRVNVHNLETKQNNTTFTVYKGTTVTPKEQLEALWNNIPIEEVVSASENDEHKRTTGASANVGKAGEGETFTVGSLMSEVAPSFDIDLLINQLTVSQASASQEFTYSAYDHESGKITVKVERVIGNQTPAEHTADTVGSPVEQYKVTFTYKPYTETERMNGKVKDQTDTDHHNGLNGRGTEETGEIKSENTHTINVFQEGVKIIKVDKTNAELVLPGAVFEVFRVDANGTADVSAYELPEEKKYTKVGDDLTVNDQGILEINPLIPDTDTAVTNQTLYLPNIGVGVTENTWHDTVFYLVEKTAPTKDGVVYSRMPGAICFTMTLTENKGADSTTTLYDWTQTANVTAEEYQNGNTNYLTIDEANTITKTEADIYAYKLKNGKPTDITLIKVDKKTGNSIGGAKFRLVKGSENVDLSELIITAISDNTAVEPQEYDYNGTKVQVITVPEGGVKIAGLADDTYTLKEVEAPAGYIIVGSDKTFMTENGAIKDHTDEAEGISFKVENEPGTSLPSTGGPGTRTITLAGLALTLLALAGIIQKRKG